jgi:hypothetical protein
MIARDRYHQPAVDDGACPVAPTDSEPADTGAAEHAAAQSDTTGSTPPGKESASSVGAVVDAGVEHADGGAAAEQRQGLQVYGDSAYGTGEARGAYADADLDSPGADAEGDNRPSTAY